MNRLLTVGVLVAMGVSGCGGDEAEPAGTYSSVSTSAATTVAADQPGQPPIREMTDDEWATFSALEDDGMVCPEPNMKAGDQFWDYSSEFDPSEYGRQPGDALADAITEMNDGYRRETGQSDGFLQNDGWTGLTHGEAGVIYYVYPETAWQHIVTVTGDASKGAWRHQKATVCVVVP